MELVYLFTLIATITLAASYVQSVTGFGFEKSTCKHKCFSFFKKICPFACQSFPQMVYYTQIIFITRSYPYEYCCCSIRRPYLRH